MEENKTKVFVDEEQESVNKTLAGEKRKLAQMTFKEKAEYIFSYYKFHILGIVGSVVIIVSLVNHYVSYQEPMLCGVLVNTYNYSDEAEQIIDAKLREQGLLEKKECAVIYADAKSEVNLSAGEYINKLDVYSAAKTVDYMLCDEAGIEYVCDHLGTALDVRDYMSPELLTLWEDRLVEIDEIDLADPSEFPAKISVVGAIDITGTKAQDLFGADNDVCYLVVTDLGDRPQNIKALFEMLYEMEME